MAVFYMEPPPKPKRKYLPLSLSEADLSKRSRAHVPPCLGRRFSHFTEADDPITAYQKSAQFAFVKIQFTEVPTFVNESSYVISNSDSDSRQVDERGKSFDANNSMKEINSVSKSPSSKRRKSRRPSLLSTLLWSKASKNRSLGRTASTERTPSSPSNETSPRANAQRRMSDTRYETDSISNKSSKSDKSEKYRRSPAAILRDALFPKQKRYVLPVSEPRWQYAKEENDEPRSPVRLAPERRGSRSLSIPVSLRGRRDSQPDVDAGNAVEIPVEREPSGKQNNEERMKSAKQIADEEVYNIPISLVGHESPPPTSASKAVPLLRIQRDADSKEKKDDDSPPTPNVSRLRHYFDSMYYI